MAASLPRVCVIVCWLSRVEINKVWSTSIVLFKENFNHVVKPRAFLIVVTKQ